MNFRYKGEMNANNKESEPNLYLQDPLSDYKTSANWNTTVNSCNVPAAT